MQRVESQDPKFSSTSTLYLHPSAFNVCPRPSKISRVNVKSRCLVRTEDFVIRLFKHMYMNLKILKAQVFKTRNLSTFQVSWTRSPIIDPLTTHRHHKCYGPFQFTYGLFSFLFLLYSSHRLSPLRLGLPLCMDACLLVRTQSPLTSYLCPHVHHRFL